MAHSPEIITIYSSDEADSEIQQTEQNHLSTLKTTAQKFVPIEPKSEDISNLSQLVNYGASTSNCTKNSIGSKSLTQRAKQNHINTVKSTARKCMPSSPKQGDISNLSQLVNFGASTSTCTKTSVVSKSLIERKEQNHINTVKSTARKCMPSSPKPGHICNSSQLVNIGASTSTCTKTSVDSSSLIQRTENNIDTVQSTAQKYIPSSPKPEDINDFSQLVNFGASTSKCTKDSMGSKSLVTSPKLSLKRNRVDTSPNSAKDDERNLKRLKSFDSNKIPDSNGETSNLNLRSEENQSKNPLLFSHCNMLKFQQLLEFCKPLMKDESETGKTRIIENMNRVLKAAQSSYVSSKEFSAFIDYTKDRIVKNTKNLLVYLKDLKLELRAYKQKKIKKKRENDVGDIINNENIPIKADVMEKIEQEPENNIEVINKENISVKAGANSHHVANSERMMQSQATNSEQVQQALQETNLPISNVCNTAPGVSYNGLCSQPSLAINTVLSETRMRCPIAQNVTTTEVPASRNRLSNEERLEIQIKRLEKYLQDLDKKIKKFQQKELTLDDLDSEDSVYILEDRYERRFNMVWSKLCKLKKRSVLAGRKIEQRFLYQGTRFQAINKAIEKLVNKKEPSKKFPDYIEVYNAIDKVNKSEDLGLDHSYISTLAKTVFEDIGVELKERRLLDHEEVFSAYLPDGMSLSDDPAEHDEELKKKLTLSVKMGEQRIEKILNEYVEKQTNNRIPAEEDNCSSASEATTAKANKSSDDDLPETEPATPETTEGASPSHAAGQEAVSNKEVSDDSVVELGVDSDATTEPESEVTKKQTNPVNSIEPVQELADLNDTNPVRNESRNSSSSGLLSDLDFS